MSKPQKENTMSYEEFSKILKQFGFKSKSEFAKSLNFSIQMMSGYWKKSNSCPSYINQTTLEWASLAKKYDELVKDENLKL